MIITSVEQNRLGFTGYRFWNIKFTSNNIIEYKRMIIKAIEQDNESIIPVINPTARENGHIVGPLTDKVVRIIESLAG